MSAEIPFSAPDDAHQSPPVGPGISTFSVTQSQHVKFSLTRRDIWKALCQYYQIESDLLPGDHVSFVPLAHSEMVFVIRETPETMRDRRVLNDNSTAEF